MCVAMALVFGSLGVDSEKHSKPNHGWKQTSMASSKHGHHQKTTNLCYINSSTGNAMMVVTTLQWSISSSTQTTHTQVEKWATYTPGRKPHTFWQHSTGIHTDEACSSTAANSIKTIPWMPLTDIKKTHQKLEKQQSTWPIRSHCWTSQMCRPIHCANSDINCQPYI